MSQKLSKTSDEPLSPAESSLETGFYPTATGLSMLEDRTSDGPQSDIHLFASARSGASRGVVIGLRSQDCFAVNFPKNHWRHQPSLSAMTYELEPLLPLDADSMLVDVVSTPVGWLAIAADVSPFQQAVAEVRQTRGWIAAASPLLMLAIEKLIRQLPKRGKTVLIWQNENTLDWVEIRNQGVCQWRWLAAADDAVSPAVSEEPGGEEPTSYILVNLEPRLEEAIRSQTPSPRVDSLRLDLQKEARDACDRIILGFERPLFNLHQGNSANADAIEPFRRPLVAALASLSLLLVVAIGALLWRANGNEREIRRLQDAQTAIFTDLFPNQTVPVGLLTRLESEHRQLQVTRGHVQDTPVIESILPVFHAFLSGTPTENRFRWDRIDFAPQRVVQAVGVAKSFGDYEAVGEALRKAGFQVPPLSTAQVPGGVSMRLDNIVHRAGPKRSQESVAISEASAAEPSGVEP